MLCADARYLCSIVEAAKLYFFCRSNGPVNLEDLKGFILMVAVKNDCQNTIMQSSEHSTSSIGPSETGSPGSALIAASTLVSQLSDGLLEKSTGDLSQVTLFDWALLYGYEALGNLLLMEKIADVKTKNAEGLAALHLAAEGGHEVMVRLALENGAEIEAKDNYGRTALFIAAEWGAEANVRLLLEKGANIHETNEGDWTAVYVAAKYGHEAVVRLLIENGAELKGDSYGGGPLHWAAGGGHEAVTRLLIENGADVSLTYGIRSWTALDLAANNGHEMVVRLLLEKGAEAAKISNGTALDLAASRGHDRVVRLLIEQGPDVVAKTSEGSALGEAEENGHEGIVKFLLEQGWDAKATKEASFRYINLDF
jgi:ankyrin repeat protein